MTGLADWRASQCRNSLCFAHSSGQLMVAIDCAGLGSIRVRSAQGAVVLLLSGKQMPWKPDPTEAKGQPVEPSGSLLHWEWSSTAAGIQLSHKPSGRTVSLCAHQCRVTDPGGREHHFEGPAPQHPPAPQMVAAPEPVRTQPEPADLPSQKHISVRCEGMVYEIRLPFELSNNKDRDLLELLFRSRRLSPDELFTLRGPRAHNRLDDLKQRLAARGAPIIETRDGYFCIAEIAPYVRRVSAS